MTRNPSLVARAFLFFAYPGDISGDAPWIAADFLDVDDPFHELLETLAAGDDPPEHSRSADAFIRERQRLRRPPADEILICHAIVLDDGLTIAAENVLRLE